jgi:asparagine synthase (glutamine-hydrolysing)
LLHDPDHKNRIGSRAALGELHGKNETLKGIMLADGKNYDNAISKSLGFIPSFLNPFISGAEKLRLITDKRSLAKYAHVDAYRALLDGLDVEKNLRGRHVLHQSLYVWSKLMLPNYLLTTLGDRMEMGHSIEGRLPYLDHKLVEFVVSLPTYYKIRNLQEKYLLRQALRPVISKTVYQRQKQVFLGPPTTGNRKDPTFQFLSEYVCDNARHLPYYNPAKVKLMVKMMPILPVKIRNKMDPILILLASLLALNEHFNIGLN